MTVNTALKNKPQKFKKQKLRNNEYYEIQSVFDELHSKSVEGKNFTDLMKVITCENNILLAYRNIKNNKGSTTEGTDGQSKIIRTGQKKNLSTIFKTSSKTTNPRVFAG